MRYYDWDDLKADSASEAIRRKLVTGERLMIARTETKKGSRIASRQHPHETFIAVIDGAWKVSFGGRELIVGTNQILHLPPNTEHSIEALDWTVALEVFAERGSTYFEKPDSTSSIEDENYLWGV